MQRIIIGGVIATIAAYAWGFAYWGANPLPYTAWHQVADDDAAQSVLSQHFPDSGVYFVPSRNLAEVEVARRYQEGPKAFVYIDHAARDVLDTNIMVAGFLLNGVVAFLIAGIIHLAAPALPSYGKRLGFVLLVGVTSAVAIDVGDIVWWYLPVDWKLWQLLYDVTLWLVVGAVLAYFIAPEKAGD